MSEYPIPEDLRELRRWIAVLFDSVTFSDSLGVEGSSFSLCRWCGGSSGPGGNPSFRHNDGCLFDNNALKKKVAGVWEEVPELEQEVARLEAQNKALCEICAAFVQSLNPEAIYPGMMRIDNVGLQKIIKQARAAIAQAKEQHNVK